MMSIEACNRCPRGTLGSRSSPAGGRGTGIIGDSDRQRSCPAELGALGSNYHRRAPGHCQGESSRSRSSIRPGHELPVIADSMAWKGIRRRDDSAGGGELVETAVLEHKSRCSRCLALLRFAFDSYHDLARQCLGSAVDPNGEHTIVQVG